MARGEDLVQLCTVVTEAEGQMLTDLLNSGGLPAMLRSNLIQGYGLFTTGLSSGWGEILVHRKNLEEARYFVDTWRVPLLEESDEAVESESP